ncbi:MAG: dihydrolipoamide acetyltransferase family protein [Armatimonadetes bacterium]|nr:dihydrolipoamide acetyltransferase family protein [Armatimonadota bacterium]
MATQVLVPPLGTNVDTVTLVNWYKAEGDAVAAGEPLFAVETDKATLDVEAPAAGILRGVSAAAGEDVAALSTIAWIAAEGETLPAEARTNTDPHGPTRTPTDAAAPHPLTPSPTHPLTPRASPWARTLATERGVDWTLLRGTGPQGAVVGRDVEAAAEAGRRPAPTPLAARIAREQGIALSGVEGTGAAGRITREDVLRAADTGRDARAAEPTDDIVETFALTGVRGKIAERMMRGSHETAPVTLTAEVDATALVARRKALIAAGLKVSFNDLLVCIIARALGEQPRMNAVYQGDRAVVRRSVDIALAVDTDRGLLAPVLRGAERMTLAQVAEGSAALIARARSGQAGPDELKGGTFTLTNLGMFGIDAFTPIINHPECAILGVGRIKPTPWVVGDCIGIRQALWLSLTFDHRLVDGGPAARFLQSVVRGIEAPGAEDEE